MVVSYRSHAKFYKMLHPTLDIMTKVWVISELVLHYYAKMGPLDTDGPFAFLKITTSFTMTAFQTLFFCMLHISQCLGFFVCHEGRSWHSPLRMLTFQQCKFERVRTYASNKAHIHIGFVRGYIKLKIYSAIKKMYFF